VAELAAQFGFVEFLLPMFPMPDPHAYMARVADVLSGI
jgi:hypothetical protein